MPLLHVAFRSVARPRCTARFVYRTIAMLRDTNRSRANALSINVSPLDTSTSTLFTSILRGCSARYEPLPSRCEPCTAVPFHCLAYSSRALLNNAPYRCRAGPLSAVPLLYDTLPLHRNAMCCTSKPLPSRAGRSSAAAVLMYAFHYHREAGMFTASPYRCTTLPSSSLPLLCTSVLCHSSAELICSELCCAKAAQHSDFLLALGLLL